MDDKKSIEDILSGLRADSPARSVQALPARNFEHLSDESVLRLYDGIRRQVDADKALGDKYRLVGPATRERADRLCEELVERGVKFIPIVW
ncbi:hypothetical protein [Bradyrhizobium betae]|uniref:Uncharacterized protein n=1 Tax=Bradyrhizobium betae TaxID=244734 RepID=A0A5P6P6B9_9BRAD|nr:hypothetical protein [Bradyrhizobium betae]MCS3731314.1 hypothetical protein [Bradyrhizobium betae]QFI73917.1 hypothetical protein F8237_16750 [Bradyrhizobium betae]